MKKTRRILLLVFGIIGMVFLAVGLVIGQVYASQSVGMVRVTGTITDFRHDNPIVSYTADGQTLSREASVSSANQRIGDPYDLMVDPSDPTRTADPGFIIIQWVFVGVGGVLLLAGIIVFVSMGIAENRRQNLLSYGRMAVATITDVRENPVVRVNGRHPWVATATCVHPLTGETVTLRSPSLWKPTFAVGQKVNVAFDPMNDKRYAFELPGEEG